MDKSPDAFRTISEVAEWLDVPTHVLRFWESRFTQIKPVKRAGGRRYYRPSDMELLGGIKKLLHYDGLTIRGVQKILREEGPKHVAAMASMARTTSAAHDPDGSPMAEDVPTERPAGEVVPFSAERTAPASTAEPGPDDALSRWPFADDPDDAINGQVGDPGGAVDDDYNLADRAPTGSVGDPADSTALKHVGLASTASTDKARDTNKASATAEAVETSHPLQTETDVSHDPAPAAMDSAAQVPDPSRGPDTKRSADPVPQSGPSIIAAALSRKIAALPAGKLATRAPDLVPLVDRMERLRARLSGHVTPDAD